jgi:LPPG:FO 2-phospho-L-lactate transferase
LDVSRPSRVALLAGGSGGAKLAEGMQQVVGEELTVIANTGDDCEAHGLYVSPDPDLVTYWLAGAIDEERGWGIRDDTFTVHERLELLGAPGWFQLSDRDLATCLYRTQFLAAGGTLAAAQAQIGRAIGARATVVPMTEQRVRTRVRTAAGWRELQEWLIVEHFETPLEEIALEGIEDAKGCPEALAAIADADLIVIGPSNPVISIGPILSVVAIREALFAADAPVVAVNPLVGGRSLKGPTELCMAAVGRPCTTAGVASLYEGLLDVIVTDPDDPEPPPPDLGVFTCPTRMDDAESRRALAERVLELGATLPET